ncbi:hypothetical protein DICPUDRAFT_85320 [Dictyostelium purpureum]|uniref:GH18 domain-containing protein n=1 Tax=Dictyostelium purpureum TaxID=5786 RepID=F1A5D0_DICPU|nr:uncharacterized protein DICPUDRAFT_85320 [Dictyostelium purpureum]EGC28599.1 hypothetical protein DICPUDRAFT_85320 [Dictyostelium purpureum]|eukprot:XP_003294873.1 hypothetical protein DICPUDRAFT_85320 [Dictyostelium purpureum]
MSNIIKEDPIHSNEFNPIEDIYELSYNSSRTVQPSYNIYNNKKSDFLLTGFLNVKDQYDGRLIYDNKKDSFGLGFDFSTVNPFAYDKITFSYFGIGGDSGIKKEIINLNAKKLGLNGHVPIVEDIVGSLESFNNVGLENAGVVNLPQDYRQTHCQGLLGGLNHLKHKNQNLEISFAIGGPEFSQPFHNLVKNLSSRIEFTQGVLDVLMRFPMFSSVEIDWRVNENNTPTTKEDCEALVLLVTELKKEFNDNGLHNIQVNLVVPGTIEDLKKYNFSNLINAGVDNFYVLTLNYFKPLSNEQPTKICHGSNLLSPPTVTKNKINSKIQQKRNKNIMVKNSIDSTVHYLLDCGVPSRKINIAYSTFGVAACDTKIKQFDIHKPLKGKFKHHKQIIGTFDPSIISYNDILTHYLYKEENGYQLFNDRDTKSDFLYNSQNKVFITLDTAKSVREKAEYVRQNRLGGLFNTNLAYDASGLLVNASKEGLGLQIEKETIDMSMVYLNGKDHININ